jgi:hypothetical protein
VNSNWNSTICSGESEKTGVARAKFPAASSE